MRVFANGYDYPLAEVPVPAGTVTNQVGFAIAAPDGQALATFDNLRLERVPSP